MSIAHNSNICWFALLVLTAVAKTYAVMDKITAACELEALHVGTRLADQFNMYDEDTEWDVRMHTEYMVEHMGFSGWIQAGLWKNTKLTAEHQSAPALHQVYSYGGTQLLRDPDQTVYVVFDYLHREVGGQAARTFRSLRIGHFRTNGYI